MARSWLCEDLQINLGAFAKECINKRLHWLNAWVAEFTDVGGLTMQCNTLMSGCKARTGRQ